MKGVTKNDKLIAYLLIFLVVIIWGVAPPLNVVINKDYVQKVYNESGLKNSKKKIPLGFNVANE